MKAVKVIFSEGSDVNVWYNECKNLTLCRYDKQFKIGVRGLGINHMNWVLPKSLIYQNSKAILSLQESSNIFLQNYFALAMNKGDKHPVVSEGGKRCKSIYERTRLMEG